MQPAPSRFLQADSLGRKSTLADWHACFEDLRRDYEAAWSGMESHQPSGARKSRSQLHWDGVSLKFTCEDVQVLALPCFGNWLAARRPRIAMLTRRVAGQAVPAFARAALPARWMRLLGRP
ncbi:hypothetical protein [Noviherbaspirillum humi]|uniref:hypothetical protein n=1 Tax=Noviherbaspirillum humi TaxID=1688639 RepID=UPI0011601062|nr:hypothetical protein [Noviherbaspirillum humi]